MFQYTENSTNQYLYKRNLNDNNDILNDCETKQQVVLENVWTIHRWEIRVFTFYSMYRGKLLFVYQVFFKEGWRFHGFRFKLAYILMHNELSGNRNENDNL